jgi:dipeptidase E
VIARDAKREPGCEHPGYEVSRTIKLGAICVFGELVKRRILAIGGGGFLMEDDPSPIDRHIVALTGKARPRICVIPTALGDAPFSIDKFYAAFDAMAETSQLTPFRKPGGKALSLRSIEAALLEQDAVFVTGGNTKSMLAVWREWGIDRALRSAYERGVLISGMSAGACAWFEGAFSDSWGDGCERLDALGWLKGGVNPHYDGEATIRVDALNRAVASGAMPSTLAIDDYAAVLFENETVTERISWRENADARFIVRDGDRVVEKSIEAPFRKLQ